MLLRIWGRRLFVVNLLLVSVLAFGDAGTAQYTRQDPPDPNYLVGYLAWTEGVGTISWSEMESEDPGGPSAAGVKGVFVSDPLPRTLHVNGSRFIQVDLLSPVDQSSSSFHCFSNYPDPAMEVRLYAGKTFLGGSQMESFIIEGPEDRKDPRTSFPPDPPGYNVCRWRIVAEMGVLTQDTTLRVEVLHRAGPARFGMAGDHRSVIRIPYFSDEDVLYRYPSYAHGAPFVPGGSNTLWSTFAGLGLAAATVTALVDPRKQRSRPAVILLLAVLGALAGCTANPPGSEGTKINDVVQTDLHAVYQRGDISQPTHGSLVGDVKSSDDARALRGVHLVLLGTPNATTTDLYGRFLFRDVPAGSYRLRADLAGYESFEGLVKVVENLIARVNVTLVPMSLEAKDRAHLHDYWQEKTDLVLMDKERFDCMAEGAYLGIGHPCHTSGFGFAFRIPPPTGLGYSSILPGTYEVNVTLDWDPASVGYSKVWLQFQANNDPAFDNWSSMIARGPGEPFRIATTWEMGDPGHQRFSGWVFSIIHWSQDRNSGSNLWYTSDPLPRQTSTEWPYYLVSITIRKGVVPLEPAHSDLWQGNHALTIIKDHTKKPTYPSFDFTGTETWSVGWLPPKLVPPETTWVEVYANASRALTPAYEVLLGYHTADDGAPSAACWANPNACSTDSSATTLSPDSSTEKELYWRIPVEDVEADPFYAPRSFWSFFLQPAQDYPTRALQRADNSVGVVNGGPLAYTLTVVAHREPLPS